MTWNRKVTSARGLTGSAPWNRAGFPDPFSMAWGTRMHLLAGRVAPPGGTDSFDFDGALSSEYPFYRIFLNAAVETDNVQILARLGTGSSYDATASDYRVARWGWTDAAGSGAAGSTVATALQVTQGGVGNAAGEHVLAVCWLSFAHSTTLHKRFLSFCTFGDTGGSEIGDVIVGRRVDTAAKTSVQILASSGQIAEGSLALLYGVGA